MSRRSGQNPKLEIRNGLYTSVPKSPGAEDRRQVRVAMGSVKQMIRKAEAERANQGALWWSNG